MNYLIAADDVKDTDCHVEGVKNVPDKHQLRFGVSRLQGFPTEANFRMNNDFPKGVNLTDVLHNTNMLFVVSARVREFLESIAGALFQNEILPVKIINHKGRTEKAPYAIIHQVDHPPCVNEKETLGTKNPINPDQYQLMKKLVLDEKQIDEKLMLFRAAQYPAVPFVRRDLAERMKAEKFTGLVFFEIDDYAFFGK